MDKALHALAVAYALWQWFAADAAPYLIAVAIPSLIAGLSASPKTGGIVAFLKSASRFLGVLTHADEPGTLKAPLGLGAIWKAFKAAAKGAAPLALVLILVASATGCASYDAWLAKHPKSAGVLDCGKDWIVATLPTVLSDVTSALSGSSPDWVALGKLEVQDGIAAVKCAALKLMQPTAGGASNPNVSKNAAAYLARP